VEVNVAEARSFLSIVIASMVLVTPGCRRAEAPPASLREMFGPVVGSEVIAGRADSEDFGRLWLLTGDRTLVTIDIDRAGVTRHPVRVPASDVCWGLARLRDGSLWTLKGRAIVAQISEEGEVLRELPLDAPQFGLFADADRLLYQPANFDPPAPILFAAVPGAAPRTAWSSIRSRPYRLARASVAALNMITCGVGRRGERPCWFPDEAAVSLVDGRGTTRRVPLDGIPVVGPELLLTSDNPPRPVRDAYVDEEGTIWILASGTPPAPADDRAGGWIVARFAPDGTPIASRRLPHPARLIVRAEPGRALLLTSGGTIAEVRP
jgi:hypothetical protein